MTITVLMPVYNAGAPLSLAIESILNQTLRDFELLIIDDHSTDGSADLIRKYSAQDDRIRAIFHQTTQGLARTLNEGLAAAEGELVARMDQDDESLPNRLKVQADFMNAHPAVAVVGSFAFHMGKRREHDRLVTLPTTHDQIKKRLRQENCIYHPTVMLRRDLVRQSGGYREQFKNSEDYDLWLRLSRKHLLANIDMPLLRYRFSINGMTLSRKWEQYFFHHLALAADRSPEASLESLKEAAERNRAHTTREAFLSMVYLSSAEELFRLRLLKDTGRLIVAMIRLRLFRAAFQVAALLTRKALFYIINKTCAKAADSSLLNVLKSYLLIPPQRRDLLAQTSHFFALFLATPLKGIQQQVFTYKRNRFVFECLRLLPTKIFGSIGTNKKATSDLFKASIAAAEGGCSPGAPIRAIRAYTTLREISAAPEQLAILPFPGNGGADLSNLKILSWLGTPASKTFAYFENIGSHISSSQASWYRTHFLDHVTGEELGWSTGFPPREALTSLVADGKKGCKRIVVYASTEGFALLRANRQWEGKVERVTILHNRHMSGWFGQALAHKKWIDRFVVIGPAISDQLVSYGVDPARISLVMLDDLLYDFSNRREKLPTSTRATPFSRPITIAIAGRISPEKGVLKLPQIAERLLANGVSNYKFRIIGHGPCADDLLQAIGTDSLASHFEFYGHREDVIGELKKVDLLLIPSDIEGVPLVLMEALLAGTPVLSTPVGDIPQYLLMRGIPTSQVRLTQDASIDALATGLLQYICERG